MPLAQTAATAFAAALIVLAASVDIPLAQTARDGDLSPPAARHDSNTIPEKIRPESGSSTDPLSRHLDQSGGVIQPPSNVDPGMTQTPPTLGPRSTPVIPPPGSSGDRPVKPK